MLIILFYVVVYTMHYNTTLMMRTEKVYKRLHKTPQELQILGVNLSHFSITAEIK